MRYRRTQAHTILRDLGDGLILRRATPGDAEALATFNAHVHRPAGSEQPHMGIAAWTQDLLSGDHPACGPDDCTIVEETSTGTVVSSPKHFGDASSKTTSQTIATIRPNGSRS